MGWQGVPTGHLPPLLISLLSERITERRRGTPTLTRAGTLASSSCLGLREPKQNQTEPVSPLITLYPGRWESLRTDQTLDPRAHLLPLKHHPRPRSAPSVGPSPEATSGESICSTPKALVQEGAKWDESHWTDSWELSPNATR